jgi:hypothetical protein
MFNLSLQTKQRFNEEVFSAVDIGNSKTISDVDVLSNNELAQTIAKVTPAATS